MRKAILHRDPREPMYIEVTECEAHEVEDTKECLRAFGDKILLTINAEDIPKLEAYIARWGGGPVGLI